MSRRQAHAAGRRRAGWSAGFPPSAAQAETLKGCVPQNRCLCLQIAQAQMSAQTQCWRQSGSPGSYTECGSSSSLICSKQDHNIHLKYVQYINHAARIILYSYWSSVRLIRLLFVWPTSYQQLFRVHCSTGGSDTTQDALDGLQKDNEHVTVT